MLISSGFVVSLCTIAAGCWALARIRPQRAGVSPPHVMLSFGFGGMLIGLWIDTTQLGWLQLAGLCRANSQISYIDSLILHLRFLPAMHVGMVAGGLLAIPALRALHPSCGRYLCSLIAQNLLCSTWMLVGMTAGALLLRNWQVVVTERAGFLNTTDGLSGMLGGMFAGMTWGMVISVALYRACLNWRMQPKHALKVA
ncbi:MAG: hypothetical protein ACKN9M_07845 [Burkholderiaceae bacterium]